MVHTPNGRIFYVARNEPNASDSNNGLYPTYQSGRDGPWQTIQHAADTMRAGDVTYVRAGTYYEASVRFANSGATDAPITLANYKAEEVIIDGSKARAKFSGIEIVGGQSHYVIQGLTFRNMTDSGITTFSETARLYQDITIQDCVMHDNGQAGIRLAAVDGFLVENVETYNNNQYGMNIVSSEDGTLSSANGVVKDSSFHDHIGKEGHGLAINQGHDIIVSDSTAYHNTIHGFDVSDWPKYGKLSYNIVLERNVSYDNGVAGFAINSDSHHVVFNNNIAWRNGAEWAGQGPCSGFFGYEGSWHVEFYNNVSVENTYAGFFVTEEFGLYSTPGDSLLIFKNNITYNNGGPGNEQLALFVEGEEWEVISTHNNWGGPPGLSGDVVWINIVDDKGEFYTADEINRGALQTGNVSVEPKFVDIGSANYRLQPGSPMVDAGTDVGLPFCEAAPDMGATELCP